MSTQKAKKTAEKAVFADISLEIAHVYLRDATPENLQRQMQITAATTAPLVAAWRAQGKSVSTKIMIDDYFGNPDGIDGPGAAELMREAALKAGLDIDFIAFEASCAQAATYFWNSIVPQPVEGEGSFAGAEAEIRQEFAGSGWLSNGDPPRGARRTMAPPRWEAPPSQNDRGQSRYPENNTSIALDVEIFKDLPAKELRRRLAPTAFERTDLNDRDIGRMWSCPFLAAVWQLIRLGAWRDEELSPKAPAGAIQVSQAAQDGTAPFFGLCTLTQLPVAMLRVEHAVRTILGQVVLHERAAKDLMRGEPMLNLPDRVCYIMTSDYLGQRIAKAMKS